MVASLRSPSSIAPLQTLHLPLPTRRNTPFRAALLIALLVHGAVLLWFGSTQTWTPTAVQDAPRTVFRFLDAPERPDPPAPKAKETPQLGTAAPTRPQRANSAGQTTTSAAQAPDTTLNALQPTESHAEAGEPPKPFPLAADVMRQATKTSAKQATLAERAAQDLGAKSSGPQGAAAALEEGFKSAGRGDCAKGEFHGGNMGLLSAPMLALALAKGECAR
jgi:hypothetical protein